MEYRVIWANEEDELAREVNVAIQEGWVPQGGVAIALSPKGDTSEDGYAEWAQAMIRQG